MYNSYPKCIQNVLPHGFDVDAFIKALPIFKELNMSVIGDWDFLLDQNWHVRCCGRSTLIALSLVAKAKDNTGEYVSYIDHCISNGMKPLVHIKNTVHLIINTQLEFQGYRFISRNSKGFILAKK